jgi:transcriptional regulator with XRE-family HTH domain
MKGANQYSLGVRNAVNKPGVLGMGYRIEGLRRKRHWHMNVLAEKLHVKRDTISRWENGLFFPDAWSLAELCVVLKTSADYLLFGHNGGHDDGNAKCP